MQTTSTNFASELENLTSGRFQSSAVRCSTSTILYSLIGPGGFEPVLSSQRGGLTEIRADKNVSHDYYERRVCSKEIRTSYHVAIRRIARSTDERTLIAAMLPEVGTDDTASIIVVDGTLAQECAAMANLNSLVLDYACAQKIGGTDIRKHNFLQLPIMGRSLYSDNDLEFIVPRVLELTYTSHSMAPFAHDLGYDGPPFTWDDESPRSATRRTRRLVCPRLRPHCEELRYILDPADVKGEDYPSETFRVLKNNEMKRYGEYPYSPPSIGCLGPSCRGGSSRKMIPPENPPGFVVRTEAQKAAFDNGYRIEHGLESGWFRYGSTTARGDIWIAGASKHGPWFLSLQYPDVAAELGIGRISGDLWTWRRNLCF